MRGIFTIRMNALLLSLVFTGNFLFVCHCSAMAAVDCSRSGMHHPCCCGEKTRPSRGDNDCPGKRAVKFNLTEKKVPGPVQLSPVAVALDGTDHIIRDVADGLTKRSWTSLYFYQHSPPDRLALYHCYLI